MKIVNPENLETTSNKMHSALFVIGLLLLIMLTERVVLSQSNTQGSIGFQHDHLADASILNVNNLLVGKKTDLCRLAKFLQYRLIWSKMTLIP